MKYKILKADNRNLLDTKVNEWIKQGWIPTGGLAINFNTVPERWYQAMVYKGEKQ